MNRSIAESIASARISAARAPAGLAGIFMVWNPCILKVDKSALSRRRLRLTRHLIGELRDRA